MSTDSGQLWIPPHELTLPTPRPIRRTGWLAAVRGQELKIDLVAGLFAVFALLAILGFPPYIYWHNPSPAMEIVLGILVFVSSMGLAASIVAFLIMAPISYFRLHRAERLLRWGRPARALVTDVRETRPGGGTGAAVGGLAGGAVGGLAEAAARGAAGGLIGGLTAEAARGYRFTLQYHDDAGSVVKSETRSSSRKFSINQVLTVLYDPDKPKRCVTYPVAGYEVGGPEGS